MVLRKDMLQETLQGTKDELYLLAAEAYINSAIINVVASGLYSILGHVNVSFSELEKELIFRKRPTVRIIRQLKKRYREAGWKVVVEGDDIYFI